MCNYVFQNRKMKRLEWWTHTKTQKLHTIHFGFKSKKNREISHGSVSWAAFHYVYGQSTEYTTIKFKLFVLVKSLKVLIIVSFRIHAAAVHAWQWHSLAFLRLFCVKIYFVIVCSFGSLQSFFLFLGRRRFFENINRNRCECNIHFVLSSFCFLFDSRKTSSFYWFQWYTSVHTTQCPPFIRRTRNSVLRIFEKSKMGNMEWKNEMESFFCLPHKNVDVEEEMFQCLFISFEFNNRLMWEYLFVHMKWIGLLSVSD